MIEATDNDDKDFIEIVSNMLRISVGLCQPKDVFIIKIDHWFNHKWLEFAGKTLGATGVWYEELRVPPFVPDRVIEQTYFQKTANGYEQSDAKDLHIYQSGDANLRRKIREVSESANFVWFSSETANNSQASLMFYVVSEEFQNGWYVSFVKKTDWQINKTKNISRNSVKAFIENDVLALIR